MPRRKTSQAKADRNVGGDYCDLHKGPWEASLRRWNLSKGLKEVRNPQAFRISGQGMFWVEGATSVRAGGAALLGVKEQQGHHSGLREEWRGEQEKSEWQRPDCGGLCRPLEGSCNYMTSTPDFLKQVCTATGKACRYQMKTGLGYVWGSWYKKYKGWTIEMTENANYSWLEKWPSVRFLFINSGTIYAHVFQKQPDMILASRNSYISTSRYMGEAVYSLVNWQDSKKFGRNWDVSWNDQRSLYGEGILS